LRKSTQSRSSDICWSKNGVFSVWMGITNGAKINLFWSSPKTLWSLKLNFRRTNWNHQWSNPISQKSFSLLVCTTTQHKKAQVKNSTILSS
jgi:hypothetical protein